MNNFYKFTVRWQNEDYQPELLEGVVSAADFADATKQLSKDFDNIESLQIEPIGDYGNILFTDDSIDRFISQLSDKIANVHIKDYQVQEKDASIEWKGFVSSGYKRISGCVLGQGSVDFDKALKELKKMNYKGLFALEAPSKGENEREKFKHNLDFLENYIKKLEF